MDGLLEMSTCSLCPIYKHICIGVAAMVQSLPVKQCIKFSILFSLIFEICFAHFIAYKANEVISNNIFFSYLSSDWAMSNILLDF